MYEKWSEGCNLAGIKHLGSDSWKRWIQKIGVVVQNLLTESETTHRIKCAINSALNVAIDCRWSSRGYNAEEATVTCCCPLHGVVLAHSHLMRKKENSSGI